MKLTDTPVTEHMTVALAERITGKLSQTTKMPCKSYSLPASACKMGTVLANVPNSVCSKCYAKRGNYAFHQSSLAIRLNSIYHPRWTEAMIHLIREADQRHFRWHDSGDIQSAEHLTKIVAIANALPDVKFWLPTQEARMVKNFEGYYPPNLTIRLSNTLIDSDQNKDWPNTSTVHKHKQPFGHECPAPTQGGKCGTCRACWDKGVKNVSYKRH